MLTSYLIKNKESSVRSGVSWTPNLLLITRGSISGSHGDTAAISGELFCVFIAAHCPWLRRAARLPLQLAMVWWEFHWEASRPAAVWEALAENR